MQNLHANLIIYTFIMRCTEKVGAAFAAMEGAEQSLHTSGCPGFAVGCSTHSVHCILMRDYNIYIDAYIQSYNLDMHKLP